MNYSGFFKHTVMKHILLLLLIPFLAGAQTDTIPPAAGLLWEDSVYQTLPVYPAGERGGAIPARTDLSRWCPVPGDQAGQHACVGFALANAMTILWAQQTRTTDARRIADMRFSPAFLYNQAKQTGDCRSGAYLDRALKIALEQGVCLLKTFPYKPDDCARRPDARQQKEAARYRIDSLQRFPLNASPDDMLRHTLHALSFQNPVVVGMRITPNFYGVTKGQERWKPFPVGGGSEGHALVAVGYDEQTKTITLFNSHGSDWGVGGFVKMTYDDYARQVRYGVVLFRDAW